MDTPRPAAHRSSTQALFDGKGFPAFSHNQKTSATPIGNVAEVFAIIRAFRPKYHEFFTPTRQMNLISKHFCLVDLISFDMV